VWDVIVVGARCAGAVAALLLARAGRSVLLVDRARFPRDAVSSRYIEPRGVGLLRRWGVLGDLVLAGTPVLDRIGDTRLPAPAYAPRRSLLDHLLAKAAVAAGAVFQDSCTVTGLEFRADRVVGVRHRSQGRELIDRARLVIGADGMRSAVAAAVRAPLLVNDAPRTCVYYGFYPGAASHPELYTRSGSWVSAIPTNDGLSLIQAYWPQDEYPKVRTDVSGAFSAAVKNASPDLWDRMMTVGRVDRFYGTGDQRNFFRTAAGPGWALIGDAAHHSDAITAHGITHAFLQAQLLTDHLPDDLAHEAALRTALDLYATQRDPLLRTDYDHTLAIASSLGPITLCQARVSVN